MLQRQDEMHAALRELELKVEEEANHFRHLERPSERQQAYQLAEHLDAECAPPPPPPRHRPIAAPPRPRSRIRIRTHASSRPQRPSCTHSSLAHLPSPSPRRRLGQTREELAECVEQLNTQRQAEAGGQEAHRLAQLVEVMDVHVNALHYLDGQSDKLDATLQQVALLGGQQAMQRAWLHENPQQYMQQ